MEMAVGGHAELGQPAKDQEQSPQPNLGHCQTCNIVKPLRAKHCQHCNR